MTLEELLALTAALEAHSEHPLAGSVLDYAESRLDPQERQGDEQGPDGLEASTSETSWLQGGETEMLVLPRQSPHSSPVKAKRRTAWLRTAKDVEPKQGHFSPVATASVVFCRARCVIETQQAQPLAYKWSSHLKLKDEA